MLFDVSDRPQKTFFLTATRNLGNSIVGSRAFRIEAIDDIEFEHHIGAVSQDSRDAAVVFIAHHNGRQSFINIKRAVVEGANLTKLTPRIVHSNKSAVVFQKHIELFVNLSVSEWSRSIRRRCRRWGWLGERPWIWTEALLCLLVGQSFCRWREAYRHYGMSACQHNFPAHLCLFLREKSDQLILSRSF